MMEKSHETGTNQLLVEATAKGKVDFKRSEAIPWLMYFCVFSADLPLITLGSCLVWGSSAIPKLHSNDTNINPLEKPITAFQTSIIVSAPAFTSTFSLILLAKVSNLLGRKKCLILHSFLFVMCLSAIALSRHIYVYYTFFFVNGLNMSGIYINSVIYNSEVADDRNRAWIGCVVGLCTPTGILLGFIFGSFTSIKVFSFICAIPAFIFLCMSLYIVESPMYLVYKNKDNTALQILEKLRNNKSFGEIQTEYDKIKDLTLEYSYKNNKYCQIFTTATSRRALFISLFLCVFQQTTGVSTMLAFAGTIFTEAGASLSADLVGILMGVMQIVLNVTVIFSVNKIGRRRFILLSIIGCSISMFILGIYFYLKSNNNSVPNYIKWLPVICALTFISSYASGMGNITASYISELFSSEFRTTGFAIAAVSDAAFAFSINFAFPLLQERLGIFSCLFIYSTISFIAFLILFAILPETTGKSFNEIQDLLGKRLRLWNTPKIY
ncbi:probable metabolite transport protein CsbC [Diabrotica undecimpunctata]|uniref:probable metabolite transport protein CsbC n=1 Tax=Diabrotica undecimpunctata TaxID=50387 RepID=UPI003B635EB4